MVLVLLVTMVILGIGLTVMWVGSSGMKVSTNITRRQEALYAAEAGIEQARAVLNSVGTSGSWQPFLAGTNCGTAPPTAPHDPDGKGNVLCSSAGVMYYNYLPTTGFTNTPTKAPGFGQMRYTVYIRNDVESECDQQPGHPSKLDCDGDQVYGTAADKQGATAGITDNNRRVIIRSEGVARDGLSQVNLEVTISGVPAATAGSSYSQAGMNAQGSNSGKASLAP
jgi:hypothetical protein